MQAAMSGIRRVALPPTLARKSESSMRRHQSLSGLDFRQTRGDGPSGS